MSRLSKVVLALFLLPLTALGQWSIPRRTIGSAGAQQQTTTIYGSQIASGATDGGNSNYLIAIYFATGNSAETPTTCHVNLSPSTNAAGAHVSCQLYTWAAGDVIQSAVSGCLTTTTLAANASGTLNLPLSGCSLAANTAYWVAMDTDDDGISVYTDYCGSTCTGADGTSTMPGHYQSQTYGTAGSGLTTTADQSRYGLWLTATP